MRALGTILGSLLLLVVVSTAGAQAKSVTFGAWDSAQRLPIIGTQYSIAVPAYFRASYSDMGVLQDAMHGATIYALPPDAYERNFVNEALHDPGAGFWLSLLSFLGRSVRVVQSGSQKFVVLTRSLTTRREEPVRMWSVIPLDAPDMAIRFVQEVRDDGLFDDAAVTATVKTLLVSKPYATSKGVYIFGLFIPAIAPFSWSAISASGDGAEISALVSGTDGYTVSIRRPHVRNPDSPDDVNPDAVLDDSMTTALNDTKAAVLVDRQKATFAGLTALRARSTKPGYIGEPRFGLIQYVAWTIGCEMSFVGTGHDKDMNDDVVWIIDRIARAARPQTSLELMGH